MTRGRKSEKSRRARPWPVTVTGLLLLVQAGGLGGLSAFTLIPLPPAWELTLEVIPNALPQALLGTAFALLGIVALWAAIGFWRLGQRAWMGAMLVQGLSLLLALNLYFRGKPPFAYGIMLYGIIVVLYLNHPDVLSAFGPKHFISNTEGHT